MKIRFPVIDYKVHIHPKPRGNWRPRVSFHLVVEARKGDCLWRPYLPAVVFLKDDDGYRRRLSRYTDINGVDVFRVEKTFDARHFIRLGDEGGRFEPSWDYRCEPGDIVVLMNGCLYSEPERGSEHFYHALVLPFPGYICGETRIRMCGSFYLPWRPGARPDYSDYAKVFSIVPELLHRLLQDGLDSGVSREYRIRFTGRPGAAERESSEEEAGSEVVFV